MTARTAESTLYVALVGNPNTGKSTLFTALAGVRQRIGNYPGVTVEKKIGHTTFHGRPFALVDLPGTYSLAPRSQDEMVAVDVLLGRQSEMTKPDVAVCIVDASNLERNLYLVSQVLELGLPTVVALNMVDVAAERGMKIDLDRLERQLGIRVVAIQANRRRGIDALKQAIAAVADASAVRPASPFPQAFQDEVNRIEATLLPAASSGAMAASQAHAHSGRNGRTPGALPRYLIERLVLDTGGYLEHYLTDHGDGRIHQELLDSRKRLATAGYPVPAVEALSRYQWVGKVLDGVIQRPAARPITLSDRIDQLVTNRLLGTLLFLGLMLAVFQSVFRLAAYPMEWIDALVGATSDAVASTMPAGALRSLLVDGVIGGVGGVLVFLPQILILFFFIGVLEDCGYMARAAFLMDKLMVRVGLSGKSFIPLLSSFACAIPGIMATRVIENRRDRLTTILVAPLMSCSARLPVYTLLIAAFIPEQTFLGGWLGLQGLTMAAMYLVGAAAAVVVALVLKRTLLKGPTPPFVMELPSYKWPSVTVVLYRMLDRAWSFVRRAGTLIVAVAVVIWAALYYPRPPAAIVEGYERQRAVLGARLESAAQGDREAIETELVRLDNQFLGRSQRQSVLGRIGHWIEPVVRPLGWDWRIGCAVVASFPAREVVVATLGILYDVGGDVDMEDASSRTQLQTALARAQWEGTNRPVFNVPVALSIMVFFALCAQCAATLAVIRRETNSWLWPAFTFGYMTALAYVAAFATYQVGMLFAA